MTITSSSRFNYFSLLDLSPNSSSDELKKAFRREAKKWHPDLNPNNETAKLRFRWINEAYKVLKDPQKRLEWEISGKPTFEIKEVFMEAEATEKSFQETKERSTNGDSNFNSAEKLLILIIGLISFSLLNPFAP
tara:strand:- start:2798 stop:3199 length:402 start_codon:yes stop_codon:yes gene_type:complete